MSTPSDVLVLSQRILQELILLGASREEIGKRRNSSDIYNEMITNKLLRNKTQKMFMDGHHASAVEEAYKLLDNIVKRKAGMNNTAYTGAALMQKVFTPNKPILKLNAGVTTSEIDEQNGYMQILAGCMIGVRNPRAHESDWEDTEERALQLIIFANHLIERAQHAEVSDVR